VLLLGLFLMLLPDQCCLMLTRLSGADSATAAYGQVFQLIAQQVMSASENGKICCLS